MWRFGSKIGLSYQIGLKYWVVIVVELYCAIHVYKISHIHNFWTTYFHYLNLWKQVTIFHYFNFWRHVAYMYFHYFLLLESHDMFSLFYFILAFWFSIWLPQFMYNVFDYLLCYWLCSNLSHIFEVMQLFQNCLHKRFSIELCLVSFCIHCNLI